MTSENILQDELLAATEKSETAAPPSAEKAAARKKNARAGIAERVFERALWESRLIMLVAVVVCSLMALGAFFIAAVDAIYLFKYLVSYADLSLAPEAKDLIRSNAITLIVKTVDGFLIAAILIIFALGLYELFINRLDIARRSKVAKELLQTRSLDDLKHRIAGLLMLILVIEFFQQALRVNYQTPVDLLYLALGLLFISGAFYLRMRFAREERGERIEN